MCLLSDAFSSFLEVITNLYGSAGIVHGEPAAYNVVEDKSDDDTKAEKGIAQDAHENESGKGMHGSGEGRYSITGKRAHIPALDKDGLRKKVSVSSLGKSSGELEKAGKAQVPAPTMRHTRHSLAKQVEAEAAEKPKGHGRGRPKNK